MESPAPLSPVPQWIVPHRRPSVGRRTVAMLLLVTLIGSSGFGLQSCDDLVATTNAQNLLTATTDILQAIIKRGCVLPLDKRLARDFVIAIDEAASNPRINSTVRGALATASAELHTLLGIIENLPACE